MFESWAIGVVLRATSNLPQTFAAASAGAGALSGALTRVQTNALKAKLELLELQQASLKARASFFLGVAGVGALAIGYSLDEAGKLQLAMTAVQMTTHSTADEMERLNNIVLSTSSQTAQSISTTAAEMLNWARVTGFAGQKLEQTFPLAARFGDVMQFLGKALNHPVNPIEAISVGGQFGHYLQAYQPAQLMAMHAGDQKGLLDYMLDVMLVQGEDMRRLLLQGKYFAPLASIMGTSPKDVMTMLALMGRTGFLRGRGGTAVENAIIAIAEAQSGLGPLGKGAKRAMMGRLGMLDPAIMAGGSFHLDAFSHDLNNALKSQGAAQFVSMIATTFGKQAGQFLTVMASPKVAGKGGQLDLIKRQLDLMPTVNSAFGKFFNTLPLQVQRFMTNIAVVATIIGKAMLPQAMETLKRFADALGSFAQFLIAHPAVTKMIAGGIVGITAGSILGLVMSLGKLFMISRAISGIRWTLALSGLARAGISAGAMGVGGGLFGWIVKAITGFASWMRTIGTGVGLFGLAQGGIIGRVIMLIGDALFHFVPIVGWAATIVAGVEGIAFVLNHLSTIINWWNQHQAQIGAAIGYAFGMIAKLVVDGVKMMYNLVAGAVGMIWQNLPDLIGASMGNAGAMADLSAKIQAQIGKNLKQYGGPGFGAEFFFNLGRGFHGQSMENPGAGRELHFHGPTSIVIKADHTTTPDQLFDKMMKAAVPYINNKPVRGAPQLPYHHSGAASPTLFP